MVSGSALQTNMGGKKKKIHNKILLQLLPFKIFLITLYRKKLNIYLSFRIFRTPFSDFSGMDSPKYVVYLNLS